MKVSEEDYLAHYGILRKSGRYPWGSGKDQNQRNKSFLDTIEGHRKDGMSETQIAELYGMKSTELRRLKSIARSEQKQSQINLAQRLKDKGYSNVEIGKRMGRNESYIRGLLADGASTKADQLKNISEMLKREVDSKDYLDIGIGVERTLPLGENRAAGIGVSKDKFQTAVTMLKEQGYGVHYVKIHQIGTGEMTTVKVLTKPGVKQKEVFLNRDKIRQIQEKSDDGGKTFTGLRPATSVSSKKVGVIYDEDGGSKSDGVIYLRPGVKKLDMGAASYAQVRIMVDGTHYIKGMAVYKDDLPAGKDIMFNTNKKKGTPLKADDPDASQVLKPAQKDEHGKIDLMRPFGAEIKAGGQRGHLNIVNEEGDWDTWSKNLPSQFLSKQKPELVKSQLAMTYEKRRQELAELNSLTNPTIKKKLLDTFADETDSAAVHLKAAAVQHQATKVILPVNSVKTHEVYAPTYRNGDQLALVRFPHGGTFEIPLLTVNNRNPEAKKLFGAGGAKDALGINHKVAERLSGADFDGDTVLAIPNPHGKITSKPALKDLENFDPKKSYPKYPGMVPIDAVKGRDQKEMGRITNLIADMTIKGANDREIASAVKHSMVVIDAKKHQLDYKQSYIDNGIPALKAKYQGSAKAGASTLITKASAEERVLERKARPAKEGGPIDRETGALKFVPTGRMRKDKHGNLVPVLIKSKKLAETEDAHSLVSEGGGTRVERLYADHSNRLKALANETRKTSVGVPRLKYNESANKVYKREVDSLKSQLNIALKNAPLERQAQVLANAEYRRKTKDRPDLEKEEKRKIGNQALHRARERTGAGKTRIQISDREWEAIQAGALSDTKLREILRHTDVEKIRERATPRTKVLMTSAKIARMKSMLASGATQKEVADALGVSLTTLKNELNGGGES